MQSDAFIILEPEAADALDHGYAGLGHKIGAGKVSHVIELIDIAGKMDLVDPNAAELQAAGLEFVRLARVADAASSWETAVSLDPDEVAQAPMPINRNEMTTSDVKSFCNVFMDFLLFYNFYHNTHSRLISHAKLAPPFFLKHGD